jgi:hypothetical protein
MVRGSPKFRQIVPGQRFRAGKILAMERGGAYLRTESPIEGKFDRDRGAQGELPGSQSIAAWRHRGARSSSETIGNG